MKSRIGSESDDLPDDLRKEFHQIVDRFEDAWRYGHRPDIDQFLPKHDRLRLAVLRELVHVDLEYRWRCGELPKPDQYLVAYPELNSVTGFVESLNGFMDRLGPCAHAAENNPLLATTGTYRGDENDTASIARAPERIGRYAVERVVGKGGFGLVYLAHDAQLQRRVAIKVPHRERVSTKEDAEAYLTEARTVANLDHSNIVPVYDVGSSEDCPCFIVSKFIDGTDLANRLKASRLPIHEAAELVATVAEALHYAHKQGLVHRDIKPGNILLDTSGKPFVVDFGMALREQDVGRGAGHAGTPAYMSPEQARGEGHRVDGRSDIFSLGVVFYELLVGRRPFTGDSQYELLEQIATFEPRPPRQYADGIPKELERICLKALAKRASERYTTAKDMADDLRHFLSAAPRDVAIPRPAESVTRLNHLLPKSGTSYECSILSMIISGVLSDFPVRTIRDSDLLQGGSLLSLYKTVEALIDRFQQICDEILGVLVESEIKERFYGSAYRIKESRLPAANRKLRAIASDMRELAGSLGGVLKRDSELAIRLSQILQVCVSISVGEDFLVVKLGTPANMPPERTDENMSWGRPTGEMSGLDVYDNLNAPFYPGELGEQMINDFRRVLGELDEYRRDLRRAIAEIVAKDG